MPREGGASSTLRRSCSSPTSRRTGLPAPVRNCAPGGRWHMKF